VWLGRIRVPDEDVNDGEVAYVPGSEQVHPGVQAWALVGSVFLEIVNM